MVRVTLPSLALVSMLALASCGREQAPVGDGEAAGGGVRVVLVTLDTLRADALGGMPLLRARAERGLRFDRFYAATSTTQPTHATLFTGLHPWEHGVTRNGEVLEDHQVTVAELLEAAGFETAAVVASFPVAARFGFAQGFAAYRDDFTVPVKGADKWEGHRLRSPRFFSTAGTITDRALRALDEASAPRQFFWFHYFDPHAPYGSSRGGELMKSDVFERVEGGEAIEAVVADVRDLYRGDVAHLDRELERLLARLEADAARFETHVVIVSDHGESLGEGGALGHGYRLHRVEILVPGIILSPRVTPGVRRDPAGSIDVGPTLLALAGVEVALPGGRDLTRPADAVGAAGMRRTFRTTQAGERRLDGSVRPVPPLLFYAVDADGRLRIGNGRRLRGSPPDGERLRERFAQFERTLAAHAGSGSLDPEIEQRLRVLGYVP